MMHRALRGVVVVLALAFPAAAEVAPFPTGFQTRDMAMDDVTLHVRTGGQGPAVLLLHGYGETGDMWAPLAAELARDHTVIVPDLRGMGLSSRPAGGYDKKTQGADVAHLLDALGIAQVDLVTHDIGNMVGYAFAVQNPARVRRFVIMDAPLPGVGPWDEVVRSHALWHFSLWGPDAERLVAGRERIYLDRFWNEFSADRPPSARRRASTMRRSTPGPAPCMPASSSSRRSTRMPPTTGGSWPVASCPCRCSRSADSSRSGRPWRW
jgi:pimeloyl-ACP methyl ester carboxylesterase